MKSNLKRVYIGVILFILTVSLIYISNITNLPENVILFEGEALDLKTTLGVNIKTAFSSNPNIERIENKRAATVSANEASSSHTGKLNLEVTLLGIKFKEINVDIIENLEVVPLGNLIGVKLYTSGVLVVGMSEITGEDEERHKPYEGSGIEEGDIISEINGKTVTCTNELTSYINDSKGETMEVKYLRDGQEINTSLTPVKADDKTYKIGLWVRDTAAGVGTATFYDPESKRFASLGHGIIDSDTEDLIEIETGEMVTANILSIVKGSSRKSAVKFKAQ